MRRSRYFFGVRQSLGLALVAALLDCPLRAQARQPDYNFFDSRVFSPAPPRARRIVAQAQAEGFAADVTATPHALGDGVREIYRLSGTLTPPSAGDAETIARVFLEDHRDLLALAGTSVFSLPLERRYESEAAGLTHLVFHQQYAGIPVFGGEVLAHVARDGSILRVQSEAAWPSQIGSSFAPALSAGEAAAAAVRLLDPALPQAPAPTQPPRLVWFPRAADAVLAWEVYLRFDSARWYGAVVDSTSGELLFSHNLYRDQRPKGSVFRAGDVESPSLGAPSVESFTGWPASAGDCPAPIYPAQYRSGSLLDKCWVSATVTTGNNVIACLDASGTNQCDSQPSNALADFEFAFTNSYALSGNAAPDANAAVTNLFYWNNVMHDWLYTLGFDEPSGNFQTDNFGRGGFGGDAVLADAQDGAGRNNSTFATPPDGSPPRMEIFLFTNNGSFVQRDGDLGGDLIAHEYTHGLTNRLVGGGSGNALPMLQSGGMGEGWSDAYACSLTGDPVIGEYVSATPATGIRSVAYNNSPYTFGQFGVLDRGTVSGIGLLADLPEVHRDGEIWATVLWDLRTALGKTAYEPVLTAALKLTPARPSMLDARNAIVQAAQAMGLNACTVWAVFARRGFGASAALNHIQSGLTADTALSVSEAYDQPVSCGGAPPAPGSTIFSDNMESGVNGWTATGLWHLTTRRASSATHSWWYGQESTGNYATGARTYGSLTSPAIAIASGAKATLEWDQYFNTEGFGHCWYFSLSGCNPYVNYDSGWVQVSVDGGSTWHGLTTLAHASDADIWDHHRIDISRWAGNTVLLRFYFDSLDANANTFEGWYVDNVVVRGIGAGGPQTLSVTPAALSFSALAGGAAPPAQSLSIGGLSTLSWTASATGGGWLAVSPPGGTGSGTAIVSVITSGLAAGTYNGSITITAAGAVGSPAVIPVTLTVVASAAEWHFDETGAGPGIAIADSSGNGHNGTTGGYGSAAFAGVAGNARAFNGFSDWAEVPGSAALAPASFTFRVWVKLLAYPTSAGWGVIAANYGGNYQGWYVGTSATGRVIFSVASLPSSAPWLVSNAALALDRWYCITAIYDGATQQAAIYINGALDVTAGFAGFTPQSATSFTFARASWFNGYYLNAALDEARLLPAAQAGPQVLADYQSFPAPPAPPATTSLAADWHFDDTGSTLADSSGNGHAGSITGTASTTGVLNSARSFNGLADFIAVPASDAFSPASFTVRLWLKLLSYPSAAGWGVALANYGGNYQGWYLGVRSSGQVILSVASLPSSSPWMLSSQMLAVNRWYYIAATYHGATRLATIYIDGVADTALYLPGFTPAPAIGLDFARASWYNGYYLDAAIDETRVYPAAKTAADILSDFQSFPPQPPASAVAEWKLDDTGSTLTDSSGNGHTGTAHGTSVAAGVVNSARSFNGLTDFVEVPASAGLSPASFTIRAWVKLLALPGGWGALVANYGGNYQGWYTGIHSSGRVIFSVSTLPSSSPWLLSNSALALNTWYCITATYDGTTGAGTIYINGVQDAQAVFPGFAPQSATDLFLGRSSWYNGYYLNTVIDEVRLLGYAQSPAEALADFQSFP